MGLSFLFSFRKLILLAEHKMQKKGAKKNTVMFKSYWRVTYMEYKIGQKFEEEMRNGFHLRNIIWV